VKVKLFKGTATAISATSPYSLYSEDLATFGPSAQFDHADSYGFCKLYGLPGMVAAEVRRKIAPGARFVARRKKPAKSKKARPRMATGKATS
jgi:hypothetical protein